MLIAFLFIDESNKFFSSRVRFYIITEQINCPIHALFGVARMMRRNHHVVHAPKRAVVRQGLLFGYVKRSSRNHVLPQSFNKFLFMNQLSPSCIHQHRGFLHYTKLFGVKQMVSFRGGGKREYNVVCLWQHLLHLLHYIEFSHKLWFTLSERSESKGLIYSYNVHTRPCRDFCDFFANAA